MVSDCVSSIRRPNPTLDRPTMRPVPAAKRGIDALDALTQMFTDGSLATSCHQTWLQVRITAVAASGCGRGTR